MPGRWRAEWWIISGIGRARRSSKIICDARDDDAYLSPRPAAPSPTMPSSPLRTRHVTTHPYRNKTFPTCVELPRRIRQWTES